MEFAKITNGASLKPLSDGKPKQIIILLHGYGSSGTDMISLAPHWQAELPDALFLAPHAPQRCAMMANGYQWWGLSGHDPSALLAGAQSAAPTINAFIDRKLTEYDLNEADLALVGFSQGTMMALHIGLRRPKTVAAIVGYSGILTSTSDISQNNMPKPPVLLVHGNVDPVVPAGSMSLAEQELKGLGVKVNTHLAQGLAHSVDQTGLQLGRDFLVKALV